MQAAGVDAHDKAGNDLFDDLAKSQGHDGQIVAAQAQDRDTDQEAQDAAAIAPTTMLMIRRIGSDGTALSSATAVTMPV